MIGPGNLPDTDDNDTCARIIPARLLDVESVEVIVIGAGQAGLASAYHLGREGIDHVILDRQAAPGGAWQHVWRSVRLVSPPIYTRLPGLAWDLGHSPTARPARRAGGIVVDDTRVAADPRIFLVGYGPSASLISSHRAAQHAARYAKHILQER